MRRRKSEELKQCPFCGRLPSIEVSSFEGNIYTSVTIIIHCVNCGAKIEKTFDSRIRLYWEQVEGLKNELVERWNRRAK